MSSEPKEKTKVSKKRAGEFDDSRTIFVGRLWEGATEDAVRTLFGTCGEISNLSLPVHKDSGRIKRIAFIEYEKPVSAKRALKLDGRMCEGSALKVKLASDGADTRESQEGVSWRSEKQLGQADDAATVYLGNLSFATDEKTLQRVCGKYGKIVRINMPLWHDTGRKRGIAFVEYAAVDSANAAVKELQGKNVDGRPIKVSIFHQLSREKYEEQRQKERTKNLKRQRREQRMNAASSGDHPKDDDKADEAISGDVDDEDANYRPQKRTRKD